MASIRIIAVPPGEAPQQVREAWVGLRLPVSKGVLGYRRRWFSGGKGDVVCAGPSRRFPVGELRRCSGVASPTGVEASHLSAGTESCVSSGNGRGEA